MIFTTPPPDFKADTDIVACYLLHGKQLLLLQRQKHKPDGGKWGLPAGKTDPGETMIQAVSREIYEETTISLPESAFTYHNQLFVRHQGRDFYYHRFTYQANDRPNVTINPEEHHSYSWYTPEAALRLPLVEDENECIRLFFEL